MEDAEYPQLRPRCPSITETAGKTDSLGHLVLCTALYSLNPDCSVQDCSHQRKSGAWHGFALFMQGGESLCCFFS